MCPHVLNSCVQFYVYHTYGVYSIKYTLSGMSDIHVKERKSSMILMQSKVFY